MDDCGDWLKRYALVYLRHVPPLTKPDVYSLQGVMRRFAVESGVQVVGLFVEKPEDSSVALRALLKRVESRGIRVVLVPEPNYFPDSEPAVSVVNRFKELDVDVKVLPLVSILKWKSSLSSGEGQ
ncbi:hypothetical protein F1D05_16240 [Kribbella qitaiheensis]|uniref:Uncharacterized protein n=1 Tax=Kribbella qitaiheensis TaxID=1544730 RepID=A0A7G6WWL7_9ACTN|nr:hypothetical protein [Kribbella qitaiheensis]QNE18382.1 hypothetical protein F1D05_11350 [Kribbella qitaiheensis]QNE19180.1 hypothetical protein F1D05_16240 [Kribbella qitaiheensis]